jgi:glycosyltransferase involved in cell wall biosynthesis
VAAEARAIFKLDKGRVEVVMNGFDQTIFHVAPVERSRLLERYGIASVPDVLITFVGKLTRFKGVDVLLEAAASYESDLGHVATLIIGEGELRDVLSRHAQDLGLEGVFFLGHLPQDEVALFLNAADLSVVPSRVEPFGLVAVEALACGTPVVATNEGGLPDFVDERVGALVDVGDALDLAKTIVQEVQSNAKVEKGPFAARYALEQFSWSGQVAKMVEVYQRVVAAGG